MLRLFGRLCWAAVVCLVVRTVGWPLPFQVVLKNVQSPCSDTSPPEFGDPLRVAPTALDEGSTFVLEVTATVSIIGPRSALFRPCYSLRLNLLTQWYFLRVRVEPHAALW